VVGASDHPGKLGQIVFDNLRAFGFAGALFPVNTRAGEVHGQPAYPSVRSIGRPVDLAVIAVPAPAVADGCGLTPGSRASASSPCTAGARRASCSWV
jgi:acyl-CoA synthetase (NDP forming)